MTDKIKVLSTNSGNMHELIENLRDRLEDVIFNDERNNHINSAAVIGILEVIKSDIIERSRYPE